MLNLLGAHVFIQFCKIIQAVMQKFKIYDMTSDDTYIVKEKNALS